MEAKPPEALEPSRAPESLPAKPRDIRSARGRRYDPKVKKALDEAAKGADATPLRDTPAGASTEPPTQISDTPKPEPPAPEPPREAPPDNLYDIQSKKKISPSDRPQPGEARAEPVPEEVPEVVQEVAEDVKEAAGAEGQAPRREPTTSMASGSKPKPVKPVASKSPRTGTRSAGSGPKPPAQVPAPKPLKPPAPPRMPRGPRPPASAAELKNLASEASKALDALETLKAANKGKIPPKALTAAERAVGDYFEGVRAGGPEAVSHEGGVNKAVDRYQKVVGEGYAPNPDLASTSPRGGPPRTNAPPLGETQIKSGQRSGLNVDVAVQPHDVKTAFREGPGSAVQSAHQIPSSAARDLAGYSRSKAVTSLMPRQFHGAFDAGWKNWSHAQVAAGRTTVTVEEFLRVLEQSVEAVPQLRGRTADTMTWLFQIEAYGTLGLSPTDLLRIPFS